MYNYIVILYHFSIIKLFILLLLFILLYDYIMLLYNILIRGVRIVGIDMPTVCACLFILRPGVLSKTLSHMWDKLNLPMFLFNVGLLTLMNMDSLISPSPQAVQPSSQVNNANRSPIDNSLEDLNPKCFINLSSKPLTQAQRSVLAKGPNFAITPRHPPNIEYIMTIESVCTKLGQEDAEEVRAAINRVLMSSHPLNLT